MRVAAVRLQSPQEAHIAAGALRAAGIEAEVFDHILPEMNWTMCQAVGCRVMVDEAVVGEARALLRDIENRSAPPLAREDEIPRRPISLAKWTFLLLVLLIFV